MYQYLLNMWIMKRITEAQVRNAVAKGYITSQEADMIITTPQVA